MRLQATEIFAIKNVLAQFINQSFKLYLYGSRADDSLKGGDIDLLCIVNKNDEDDLNLNKYKILAAIKSAIGDQKIDLSIKSEQTLQNDIFFQNIFAGEKIVLL